MPTIHLPEPNRPYVLFEAAIPQSMSGVDEGVVETLFRAHGAVLFRGYSADVPQFRDFARQFCPTSVINESPGRTPIDMAHGIQSVNGGTEAFALHPELSREPWKPDAAFFACLSAPSAGGATTLCDGIALAKALPPEVRDGLATRRLVYVQRTWPELLRFWLGTDCPSDAQLAQPPAHCPYEFRRLNGQIARIFSRPALHRPMFSAEPAFGNFLLFSRFNNGSSNFPVFDDGIAVPETWLQAIKAAADALAVPVAWQAGDVLMLDNSRFMHGRTPILDSAERQIATFFGYLHFAPINAEEPPDPLWRKADFSPPSRPG